MAAGVAGVREGVQTRVAATVVAGQAVPLDPRGQRLVEDAFHVVGEARLFLGVLRGGALEKGGRRHLLGVAHHDDVVAAGNGADRSEEHTSELQSLMRISYAVFCLKKKKT